MKAIQILGACPHDCPDTCALVTTVENGKAIQVKGNEQHPMTAGVLCTKVSRYADRTYHPERILSPRKRIGPKGPNQALTRWVDVSWEEALTDIAAKLSEIARRNPAAILPYSYAGTMGLVQGEAMSARFFHALGAARLDKTICSSAGTEALVCTYGSKTGMRIEGFAQSRLILIWGSNSIGSNLHFWRLAQEAKRKGAKLVCIDPRRTETADHCHVHLQLKPGTDAALAFAIMHELIVNNWLDQDYIDQYSLGWEELRERALLWTPERAAEVCGLDVQAIRDLAKDYANIKPAAIRLNYGVQRARGGGNAVRAVACLPTLVGAWRDPAGGMLLSNTGRFKVNAAQLGRADLLEGRQPPLINMSTIGDVLCHDQKIQALVVYNSNPVSVAPDSSKVVKGFAREDLFTVVLEHFQTDTADYADYVLPATTQLEHWDIHTSYGHTDVVLNQPAIEPLGQAKPNSQIFRELARQMGMTDDCFNDSDQDLCRQAYECIGAVKDLSYEQLLKQGFAPLSLPAAPYALGGFETPSGKCEMASSRLASQGLDPLPDYLENYEPAESGSAYPLAMISPPARNFLNSTFVNLQSLRDMEGEPLVEIHPVDAQARGIANGQTVEVFNQRGRYHCKAKVSERARPGMVVGLGIWWRKMGTNQTNVNQLTHQFLTDLGRAPSFYDCAVDVRVIA